MIAVVAKKLKDLMEKQGLNIRMLAEQIKELKGTVTAMTVELAEMRTSVQELQQRWSEFIEEEEKQKQKARETLEKAAEENERREAEEKARQAEAEKKARKAEVAEEKKKKAAAAAAALSSIALPRPAWRLCTASLNESAQHHIFILVPPGLAGMQPGDRSTAFESRSKMHFRGLLDARNASLPKVRPQRKWIWHHSEFDSWPSTVHSRKSRESERLRDAMETPCRKKGRPPPTAGELTSKSPLKCIFDRDSNAVLRSPGCIPASPGGTKMKM